MILPKFQKMYDDAVKDRDAILEELKPLRVDETRLQEAVDKLMVELRKVREHIVSIEQPGLAEATGTIKVLGKSPNGKTLHAETLKMGLEVT